MRRNHRMSRAAVSLAAFCASLVGYAALAQSTETLDVATVPACARAAHPTYSAAGNELIGAVASYNAKEKAFGSACHEVDADDAARMSSCQSQQASLRAEKASLLARLRAFNADVDTATHEAACSPPSSRPLIGGATEIQGTVYWETSDGRRVPVRPGTPIFLGEHLVLGPDSHAKFVLKDDTTFTMGPNSDMVLDEFVYDPDTSLRKISVDIFHGAMRWVTGKLIEVNPSLRDPSRMQVKTGMGTIGVRGTDFEVSINADQSESIRLYKGHVDFTSISGSYITLDPGQMINIGSDGSLGQTMSINP